MALQSAAVEILIEKAKFEAQVALGIAEAIEATIMHAQLVTVPILDARLQELRAEMRISQMTLESKFETRLGTLKSEIGATIANLEVKLEGVKAELVRWVFLAMLGNVALSAGVAAILKYLG